MAQSDDGEGAGDPRLVYVPPLDWPANSPRPVIDYGDFPRYIGTERRVPAYFPTAKLPNVTNNLLGHIPQVNHTFGYWEGDYAISNEHGVSFGESTCSARTYALPVSRGGTSTALLTMNELSRLAAERAKTAREAVLVMGALASTYGFVGTAAIVGGESLLLADPNEQFIFHILAESDAGGAIWGAQRVPRHHATVVANAFVLGEMPLAPNADFLFSENMRTVAKASGWWDGVEPFHFTRAFSIGEYTNHGYSGRRMWAFWQVVAPTLRVPAEYSSYLDVIGTRAYPTSAPPDHNVTRDDVLKRVYRNYYQGTKYDLSAGPAAGPFGMPYRHKPGPGEAAVAGQCGPLGPCSRWERSIASFRSVNIHATWVHSPSAAGAKATFWFAPYAAVASVFVPLLTNAAAVPDALADVSNRALDRTKAYWAFKELGQFSYPRWRLVRDEIDSVAAELEAKGDELARRMRRAEESGAAATAAANAHATSVVQRWQELYTELLVRFSDGFEYDGHETNYLGYPAWWLTEIGYMNGTAQPCNTTTGTC